MAGRGRPHTGKGGSQRGQSIKSTMRSRPPYGERRLAKRPVHYADHEKPPPTRGGGSDKYSLLAEIDYFTLMTSEAEKLPPPL
jgi:hypothetical protein